MSNINTFLAFIILSILQFSFPFTLVIKKNIYINSFSWYSII